MLVSMRIELYGKATELLPGATVMVGRAPEGEDPEVTLAVVMPKKVPAAVGGGGEAEEGSGTEAPEELVPPPPPAADAEES